MPVPAGRYAVHDQRNVTLTVSASTGGAPTFLPDALQLRTYEWRLHNVLAPVDAVVLPVVDGVANNGANDKLDVDFWWEAESLTAVVVVHDVPTATGARVEVQLQVCVCVASTVAAARLVAAVDDPTNRRCDDETVSGFAHFRDALHGGRDGGACLSSADPARSLRSSGKIPNECPCRRDIAAAAAVRRSLRAYVRASVCATRHLQHSRALTATYANVVSTQCPTPARTCVRTHHLGGQRRRQVHDGLDGPQQCLSLIHI